jgi:hypothetical protein
MREKASGKMPGTNEKHTPFDSLCSLRAGQILDRRLKVFENLRIFSNFVRRREFTPVSGLKTQLFTAEFTGTVEKYFATKKRLLPLY